MPDPVEEAKTAAQVLETRSVYNRIGRTNSISHWIFFRLFSSDLW